MHLQLMNEYPYPWVEPSDPDADPCLNRTGPVIPDVIQFEWLHTLTVEFKDQKAFDDAREFTGWKRWGSKLILEAETSAEDGYDHPAIVLPAQGRAYCGFYLIPDGP
ncbi:MAG: hypothetical protein ACK443_05825 [Methylococcaceae bacterium]|jgi:hypothetical protein